MSKRTTLILSIVVFIFSIYSCFFSCFSREGSIEQEGDYETVDFAIIFEVPDFYNEGLEIAHLDEGTQLYIPEGSERLYCELSNDEGDPYPGSKMMCLVEFVNHGEKIQGWVLQADIKKNYYN